MPELPEVETVRSGLEPFMKGRTIARAEIRRDGLRAPFSPDMAGRLAGRRVEALERRAKYLLIRLEPRDGDTGGDVFVIHLGMSGRMTAISDGAGYTPEKHDHIILIMDDGIAIAFNDARRFGQAFILADEDVNTHPAFKGLGPEPLSDAFTGPVLAKALKGKSVPVKTALMDQRLVAGIGNIYACEALYQARIDPMMRAADLSPEQAKALVAAIKDVLVRAIRSGGSSLKDHRQADGTSGYFQHDFAVYGRAGEICRTIRSKREGPHMIEKTVQAGRTTFYCPTCQGSAR